MRDGRVAPRFGAVHLLGQVPPGVVGPDGRCHLLGPRRLHPLLHDGSRRFGCCPGTGKGGEGSEGRRRVVSVHSVLAHASCLTTPIPGVVYSLRRSLCSSGTAPTRSRSTSSAAWPSRGPSVVVVVVVVVVVAVSPRSPVCGSPWVTGCANRRHPASIINQQ